MFLIIYEGRKSPSVAVFLLRKNMWVNSLNFFHDEKVAKLYEINKPNKKKKTENNKTLV